MEVCLFFFLADIFKVFVVVICSFCVCCVVCVCVYPHAFSVLGNQKKALYTLELELRIVASYHGCWNPNLKPLQ